MTPSTKVPIPATGMFLGLAQPQESWLCTGATKFGLWWSSKPYCHLAFQDIHIGLASAQARLPHSRPEALNCVSRSDHA